MFEWSLLLPLPQSDPPCARTFCTRRRLGADTSRTLLRLTYKEPDGLHTPLLEMRLLILLPFISVSAVPTLDDDDAPHDFRNFKLIRINPESEDTLHYLKALYEGSSPYELDFWQPPTRVGGVVDVTVGPSDAPIFVKDLESKRLNYVVAVNDLEQAIKDEKSPAAFYHPEAGGFAYDKYNSLDDIHGELKRLKKDKSDMVTLIDIGQSHENKTLLVIKLSGKRAPGVEKGSVWIDAGIHAREWIAPATAMYIIHELVHGYETDPEVQKLLDHLDFYILPVMNPDGYEYSRVKNRMWRKNRSPATCKRQHFHTVCCSGVDLNRNFGWFWASGGSSADACHETYHGASAFSEPESMAVRDFLEVHKPHAFISLHSYSQMWLIPYGHRKRSYPQDFHSALRPLALKATKALYELYGTKYQVGTGADMLYEASGGSHDWAKGSLKVPYAYLIELRPKNSATGYGFLLPEREIPATGLETFEAIKVVADEVVSQFVQSMIREIAGQTKIPVIPRRGYQIIETTTRKETEEVSTMTETEAPVSVTESTATTTTETITEAPELTSTIRVPEEPVTMAVRPEVEPPIDDIKCVDYGNYCRLWGILQLCDRPSVLKLCTKTCARHCQL